MEEFRERIHANVDVVSDMINITINDNNNNSLKDDEIVINDNDHTDTTTISNLSDSIRPLTNEVYV